ncbi:MAG TPA: J domain-containing protein [Symbiobacteriaceae bacterium]
METYYDILGVPRTATQAEIRAAFRKLARLYHPDANRTDPQAEAKFKRISEAYTVLSNPVTRRAYDATLDAAARQEAEGDRYEKDQESNLYDVFTYIAAVLAMRNTPWTVIAAELLAEGCPRPLAIAIARWAHRQRIQAVRKESKRIALIGLAWSIGTGLLAEIFPGLEMILVFPALYANWQLLRAGWLYVTGRVPGARPPQDLPDPLTGPDIDGFVELDSWFARLRTHISRLPLRLRLGGLALAVVVAVVPILVNRQDQQTKQQSYYLTDPRALELMKDVQSDKRSQQPTLDTATKTPERQKTTEADGIRLGMTKDEAWAIMGVPDEVYAFSWEYGPDTIFVDIDGRVSGWVNRSGTLNLHQVTPNPAAPPIWFGTTVDEVMTVMGTPDEAWPFFWRYGNDQVFFDADGRVNGWRNSSGRLRVRRYTPQPGAAPIRVGSTRDDVVAALGTPEQASSFQWSYGVDVILFDVNYRVSGWQNKSGTLPVGN